MADTALTELIKQKILTSGPLTFAEFMDLALYQPEWGYYTSEGEKIGYQGDFYTSPEVHPVFGRMLAEQFRDMWQVLGRPGTWQLVEYGAGKGLLARDILRHLQGAYPECAAGLTYWIIEISPALRRYQQNILSQAELPEGQVRWVDQISRTHQGSGITGCVFSNELVDAFPFHRLVQGETELQELFVSVQDGVLTDLAGQISNPLLAEYIRDQSITLEPGQQAEANLVAGQWLQEVAANLERGFLLTIDYGHQAADLYDPVRFNGTMRCFYRHQLEENPYLRVGEQDITASVNFTVLQSRGEKFGLQTMGLLPQEKFLMNLGILETLPPKSDFQFDLTIYNNMAAIKKLIMPEGMGRIFKVLLQKKGLAEVQLKGLQKYNFSAWDKRRV